MLSSVRQNTRRLHNFKPASFRCLRYHCYGTIAIATRCCKNKSLSLQNHFDLIVQHLVLAYLLRRPSNISLVQSCSNRVGTYFFHTTFCYQSHMLAINGCCLCFSSSLTSRTGDVRSVSVSLAAS